MRGRVSVEAARQTAATNKRSRSRGRSAENFLEPECWPVLQPKFRFEPGVRLFTIGSCFARNMERHMALLGFQIPTMQIDPKYSLINAASSQGGSDPIVSAIFNKYTPPSIYQELKWAYDIRNRDDRVRESDCQPLFLNAENGQVCDLHVFPIELVDYQLAIERRQAVYTVFRQAFDAEVVIITLGLIEAWWDSKSDLYALKLPDQEFRFPSGRFFYERLMFAQCYDFLCKALDLLDSTGKKKHLLTASPVVLQRTFTRDDVIVANMYSKSVLRAVAGQISSERENVDYFPSFESVILTKQNYVWSDDLMHVSDGFVSRIADRVAVAYAGRPLAEEGPRLKQSGTSDAAQTFADVMLSGDYERGARKFAEFEGDSLGVKDGNFHVAAAFLMQQKGDKSQALQHARLAIERRGLKLVLLYRLVGVLRWAGESEVARELHDKVVARCVAAPRNALVIMNWLSQRGDFQNAVRFGERVATLGAGLAELDLQLAKIYNQAGRLDDAVRVLRRAIAVKSEHALAHFMLGVALLSTRSEADAPPISKVQESEGISELERAAELDPGNDRYLRQLARAYRMAGMSTKAAQVARQLRKLAADSGLALMK